MEMNKYLGLLKWSLNFNDGTVDNVQPMDEERKKWLQKAIEENVTDPADQMKALIQVLKLERKSEKLEENQKLIVEEWNDMKENEFVKNKCEVLRALEEWVESIDWAMDLHNMGGFQVVIDLFKNDPSSEIRAHALEVFATTVQNNPKCQDIAFELNVLPVLMKNFERSNLSEKEQLKTILAISCFVRGHSKASISFIKDFKGVNLLVKIIHSKNAIYPTKSRIKALFLIDFFLTSIPGFQVAIGNDLVICLNDVMISNEVPLTYGSLQALISIYSDINVVKRIHPDTKNKTMNSLKLISIQNNNNLKEPYIESLLEHVHTLMDLLENGPKPADSPLKIYDPPAS